MSTYVFSDIHGHRAALERALERLSPSSDDRFYCLGDMIDRGPDPLGVVRVVRGLPNMCALMGNHEDLMVSCLTDPDDPLAALNWGINGGVTTSEGLVALGEKAAFEIVEWAAHLPRWACAEVAGRLFMLVHAGVRLLAPRPDTWDVSTAEAYLAAQDDEDITWIREEFWGARAGLGGEDGAGPVIVAGHTPTPYLERMSDQLDRPAMGPDGLARMVRVGEDRWDVDCGAAGGAGFGQVLILRLDDGAELYEPIREGE